MRMVRRGSTKDGVLKKKGTKLSLSPHDDGTCSTIANPLLPI